MKTNALFVMVCLAFALSNAQASEYFVRTTDWKFIEAGQYNNGEKVQKSKYEILNNFYSGITSQCFVSKSEYVSIKNDGSIYVGFDQILKIELETIDEKNTFQIYGYDDKAESEFKVTGFCDKDNLGSLALNLGLKIEDESVNLMKININYDSYLKLNKAFAEAKRSFPSCSCDTIKTSNALLKYFKGDHSEFIVRSALEYLRYRKLVEILHAYKNVGKANWRDYDINKQMFEKIESIESKMLLDHSELNISTARFNFSFPFIDSSPAWPEESVDFSNGWF